MSCASLRSVVLFVSGAAARVWFGAIFPSLVLVVLNWSIVTAMFCSQAIGVSKDSRFALHSSSNDMRLL